jgi:hypothetical protein
VQEEDQAELKAVIEEQMMASMRAADAPTQEGSSAEVGGPAAISLSHGYHTNLTLQAAMFSVSRMCTICTK